jgi:hypothetical protein
MHELTKRETRSANKRNPNGELRIPWLFGDPREGAKLLV